MSLRNARVRLADRHRERRASVGGHRDLAMPESSSAQPKAQAAGRRPSLPRRECR